MQLANARVQYGTCPLPGLAPCLRVFVGRQHSLQVNCRSTTRRSSIFSCRCRNLIGSSIDDLTSLASSRFRNMGWCGLQHNSSTWQHGTVNPCSSQTVIATFLLLFALAVIWAASRRVRLLRGYRCDQQRSQVEVLAALAFLSASHCALFVLYCIRGRAAGSAVYKLFFEATAGVVWAAAAVRANLHLRTCRVWLAGVVVALS